MYAVIETGGKQYRVQPGDFIQVEKLDGTKGSAVNFEQVLLVSKPGSDQSEIWMGKPYLSGALVQAEVVGQGRGDKVLIIKMKRRKGYRKTQGHRQSYTQLLITGLKNGAGAETSLSDNEKKMKLASFQSHLKERGPEASRKTLGSRKKMKAARTKSAANK